MGHGKKFLAGTILLGAFSLVIWAFENNNSQLQKDVEGRMTDLHQVYNQFVAYRTDLAMAQQSLSSPQLTLDQKQTIRARMDKDRDAIQANSSTLVGDINFLQTNWAVLTQAEKDFVNQVNKDLQI